MAGKPIYDLATAIAKHLDGFGVVSPNLVRDFYPGLSLRTYSAAYQSVLRRPLAHFPKMKLLAAPSFRSNKLIPLDEAMIGLGDALVLSLWSGDGDPLIGDHLDSYLVGHGLEEVDLPSRARLGFLGTGAVFGKTGRVVLPCYMGSGTKSSDRFRDDVESRWFETWHPVLALGGIQEVVVVGHGMLGYHAGVEKLRGIAKVALHGLAHARVGGARLRALRGLRWHFVFLQLHKPPVGKVLGEYHRFKTLTNGTIRHELMNPTGSEITPLDQRQWLWLQEDIIH